MALTFHVELCNIFNKPFRYHFPMTKCVLFTFDSKITISSTKDSICRLQTSRKCDCRHVSLLLRSLHFQYNTVFNNKYLPPYSSTIFIPSTNVIVLIWCLVVIHIYYSGVFDISAAVHPDGTRHWRVIHIAAGEQQVGTGSVRFDIFICVDGNQKGE